MFHKDVEEYYYTFIIRGWCVYYYRTDKLINN